MPDKQEPLQPLEEKLCEHLGIKPGFIQNMLSDSDWGFAIKVHALIEIALTNLITARFKEPLLLRIISNLETSSEEGSKLSILKELKLLAKEHRGFIRQLSRMRNAFAHDIRKIDSTLDDYCAENPTRANELRDSIAPLVADPSSNLAGLSKTEFLQQHLKLAIIGCVLAMADGIVKMTIDLRAGKTVSLD